MERTFTVEDFGKRLRELRKAQGYSQEGFALTVELDRTYIGGIERGERNPGLKTILSRPLKKSAVQNGFLSAQLSGFIFRRLGAESMLV